MRHDTLIPYGKDIRVGTAPNTVKVYCGTADYLTPGAAIVVQDDTIDVHNITIRSTSSSRTHSEDVRGRASPDARKAVFGTAMHLAPSVAIIVHDSAIIPNSKDIRGGATPNTVKVHCGAATHGNLGTAIVV